MIPILYVDDEPALLEVTKIFMELGGEFSVDICPSAADALVRLENTPFEAVISDYEMPGMDGLEFLKIFREKYPVVPFILFTGKGREEVAIEALNSGADFYLQKGGEPRSQFAELTSKVRQLVRRRAAERALEESKEKFRTIYDHAPMGIFHSAVDGNLIDANPAFAAMFGYDSPEEMIGSVNGRGGTGTFYADPESRQEFIGRVRDATGWQGYENRFLKKDGSVFSGLLTCRLIDHAENGAELEGFITDVTVRVEAEERALASRRLYAVLSRISQAIVRVRDLETLLVEICRIAVGYGHFRMAWVGLVDREKQIISPVARDGYEDGYLAAISLPLDASPEGCGPSGTAFLSNKPVIVSDIATDPRMEPWREETLRRGYRSTAAFPFTLHGEVVGILNLYADRPGFFTDAEVGLLSEIAGNISFALGLLDEQARRARAEQALAGSEERARFLATILEMSSQPFFTGYDDGRFGVANPAFLDLVGYSEAELRNLSWNVLIPPEMAGTARQELGQVIETGTPRRYETEFIRKDASRVPVEIFIHRTADSGGSTRYFSAFVTDITGPKQFLTRTLQARKVWEAIFSAIGTPALVLDPTQTILEANDVVVRMTGKTREQLRTMKCWQVFHEGSTGPVDCCPFERMNAGGSPGPATTEIPALGGTYLVSCTPVTDETGNLLCVIHIATDITPLKRAEKALSDSESRYRTIFEKSTDAVVLMNGNILDCNPAAERLWGLARERIIGHDPVEFSPPVQPDGTESKEAAATYNLAAYEWGTQFYPWQYRNSDGRLVDCDVSLSSVSVAGERRLIAIIRDVTARKQAEATIEKSEQTLRLITDSVSDMVWLTSLDLVPVYISPSVVTHRGYTLEELQALPLERRLAPESCAVVLGFRDELMGTGDREGQERADTMTLELEFCKKGGGTFWSENTITLVRDDAGRPVQILAVGRDITERKQIGNQVRRLASFPQMDPEPVIEFNLTREITYANSACLALLEKLRMPKNPAAFLPPDTDEIIASLKGSHDGVVRREVAVGDALFEESLTLSPGGIAVRIYAHDITARHQENDALLRANRKLHLLTGITRHDIRNRLTAVLGYLELAKSSTGDPTLQQYLTRSEIAAVAIRHQIEFTKEYETLGSSPPVWHDLPSLIASARDQLDPDRVAFENSVAGVSIYADPMFAPIIRHLVENSLGHGGEQLTRIRFSGSVTPDGYVLVCEDDGAGIPKKDKAAIFKRVVGEDTKISLFLIQEILALTMIVIRENGEPGKGARFELTVPPGAYRVADRQGC